MNQNTSGTALITGASSGIGEAFVYKLAAQNYDLIIVARRQQRLKDLARDIKRKYPIVIEVVVADLSNEQDMIRVEQYIRRTDNLEILINNAGFGTPGTFAEIPVEKTVRMIHVHILASTRFSWAALQGMLKRNKGAIINVSSMAAFLPFPTAVSYCSTKAYLNVFSEALQRQLRDTNISIQALCPGYTHTGFHDTHEYQDFQRSGIPTWFWMSSEEVVEQSLEALSKKQVIFIPGLKNRMLAWLMRNSITSYLLKKVETIYLLITRAIHKIRLTSDH